MTWIAIPAALLVVVSTFVGGILALRLHRELPTLIALTGGVVLGVALFDVLPEAIDAVDDSARVGTLVGAGFLLFFLAERALVLHHRDEPEQARAHEQVGVLGAAGLSVHSFIDGLGIGLAFGLDTSTGVLVLIAVLAHDFADGLNTVGFILSQSGDRRKALRWLSIDAVAPLIGAIVGASLSVSENTLGHLLALYAGFFLYMGATDLLPEAHQHPSRLRVALTAAGFGAVFVVATLARASSISELAAGEVPETVTRSVVGAEALVDLGTESSSATACTSAAINFGAGFRRRLSTHVSEPS